MNHRLTVTVTWTICNAVGCVIVLPAAPARRRTARFNLQRCNSCKNIEFYFDVLCSNPLVNNTSLTQNNEQSLTKFLLRPPEWWRSIVNVMSTYVCVSVCPRAYLRSHTRDLYQFLHFARVVDDAKCIVVTRVYVCLSVRGRTPTLLHGPGCNLGAW